MLGRRTCRTGFTLIELLVVIAIIGILAAMLFPYSLAPGSRLARPVPGECEEHRDGHPDLPDGLRPLPPKHSDEECRQFLDSNNQALGPGRCIGNSGDRFDGANPTCAGPSFWTSTPRAARSGSARASSTSAARPGSFPSTPPSGGGTADNGAGDARRQLHVRRSLRAGLAVGWGGSVTDSIAQLATAEDDANRFIQNIAAASVTLKGRSTAEVDDASQWLVCGDSNTATARSRHVLDGLRLLVLLDLSDADASASPTSRPSARSTHPTWVASTSASPMDMPSGGTPSGDLPGRVMPPRGRLRADLGHPVGNIKGTCPTYNVIN